MHDYYALSFKTVVFKDSCKTLCCRFLSLHLLTHRIKRRERQWPRGHPWRCPKLIRRGKHCAYSYMSVSPCFQSFTHRSRYLAFLVVSSDRVLSLKLCAHPCVFAASRTKSTPQRTKRDNTSCRCIIRSFVRDCAVLWHHFCAVFRIAHDSCLFKTRAFHARFAAAQTYATPQRA